MTQPVARFKDLSIDVVDAQVSAPFWGAALGLDVSYQEDGHAVLRGSVPERQVWVTVVPEPRTVKQRVHLDLHAASVADIAALGAQQVSADGEFPWTVLVDPEGGELCVFVRDELPDYRLFEVVVDAVEPFGIARWWADVLGAVYKEERDDRYAYIEQIPGASFDSMAFVPVPEPKTVKNRIHWDVTCGSVDALVAAGATVLRARDAEIGWTVLADPEGNEFCAFTD